MAIRGIRIGMIMAVIAVVIIACGGEPSDSAIQTAIALTDVAKVEVEKPTSIPDSPPPTNTPIPSPTTLPPSPTSAPIEEIKLEDKWSKNYVGSFDSGGVIIEIARVVVGYKSAIPEQDWSMLNEYIEGWEETEVVGELIIKLTNNTDKTISIYLDQGSVQIGSEQIDLSDYMFGTTFGDDIGGDFFPGVISIGGMWFGIKRSTPEEISEIIYRAEGPSDVESWDSIGPDIEIRMDFTDHIWEDMPPELD